MNSIINPGSSEPVQASTAARCALSVIIVAWNVKGLLRGCLQSLQDDGVPDWAEVIVFDNASTDGSSRMVEQEFPWARLIRSPQNLGFSRGNNLAIEQAAGDFILLLNPDTVVHAGTLRRLVEYAETHPEVGVIGPKLYNSDGTVQFEGAVNFPTAWSVFCDLAFLSRAFPGSRLFCRRKMGFWDHEGDRPVPAISGAAMAVRREIFDQIGLLDETMFCAEDMDFCKRLRNAGWTVFYLGSTSVVHFGGGSTSQCANQGLQRQIAFQSFWLYTRKNRGWLAAAAVTAMVLLWSLGAIAATIPLAVLFRGNVPRMAKVRRFRDLAASLLVWSVANKKQFRHYLAAPQRKTAASNRTTRGSI